MGIFVDPQNLKAYEVYSFVGGNPTLEIDKGERPPFLYKRGLLPLNLEGKKKGKSWASLIKEWEALMSLN